MYEKIRASGMFVAKSAVFAIVFWTVWFYVMRPITSTPAANTANNSQAKTESGDGEALMKKSWEQARLADSIQNKYQGQTEIADRQQKHMDVLLAKQDEQARRFDAILSAWEKQAKVSK